MTLKSSRRSEQKVQHQCSKAKRPDASCDSLFVSISSSPLVRKHDSNSVVHLLYHPSSNDWPGLVSSKPRFQDVVGKAEKKQSLGQVLLRRLREIEGRSRVHEHMGSVFSGFDDLLDVPLGCDWIRGGLHGDDSRKKISHEVWELISESKANGDAVKACKRLKEGYRR